MTFVASGQVGRHFGGSKASFCLFSIRPLDFQCAPSRAASRRARANSAHGGQICLHHLLTSQQPSRAPHPPRHRLLPGRERGCVFFFGKVVDGQSCPPLNVGKALGVKAASTNPLRGCCRLRCVCVLVRARAARVAKRRETAPGRARRRSKTRRALAAFPAVHQGWAAVWAVGARPTKR